MCFSIVARKLFPFCVQTPPNSEYNSDHEDGNYCRYVAVDAKTGEEEEDVLYVKRAKLYRFAGGEWKECGLGELKILRHKFAKSLRVVMRRDRVLKTCLNHALTDDIQYTAMDHKSWLFNAIDFSEGYLTIEKFSLRFKDKEAATEFIVAVNAARAGTALPIGQSMPTHGRAKRFLLKHSVLAAAHRRAPPMPTTVNANANDTAPSTLEGAALDIFGRTTEQPKFGAKPTFVQPSAISVGADEQTPSAAIEMFTPKSTAHDTPSKFVDLAAKLDGLDFASLAAAANADAIGEKHDKPDSDTYIGLTKADAFTSFQKRQSNDTTNDTITTVNSSGAGGDDSSHLGESLKMSPPVSGEEHEMQLFAERATLYRFDTLDKVWKERGIGVIKILQHAEKGTYRVLMRRDLVHKLVLNHHIGKDFSYTHFNDNPKSFCWAAMNFGEHNACALDKLAVRFKSLPVAKAFAKQLDICIGKPN